jgi:SNF2 family DNA or RNA helicase
LRVVLIASRDVEDLPTFGIDQFAETQWRREQALGRDGEQLIAQPPTHLEVIEFRDGHAERQLQDTLKDAVDVVRSTNGAASLLAEILLRAISSSPAAAEEVVRRLRNRVVHGSLEFPDPKAERGDEEDTDELIAIPGEIGARLAEVLDRCLVGLESQVVDSKLHALVQHLVAWQIRGGLPEAICILTEYHSTLFYVQTELEQRGLRTYLLHSSMNFDQQSRAILEFKQRKGVLVATNASVATGFELPHVDVVIFYDLPHSPMMLQQLLGRFWRVGRSTALNLIALSRPEGAHPIADTILGKLRMLVHSEERFGIVESD